MIKLSLGSIFDKKCDVLIVPCNAAGGVTEWVWSELKENGLPFPPTPVPFGTVSFVETKLSLENAGVVGFAASVEAKANRSSIQAISDIGRGIYEYCKQNEMRQVNVPLLGTGAGRLAASSSFEALSSAFGKQGAETCFEIFVPDKETYRALGEKYQQYLQQRKEAKISNPRVFMSYASDDDKNREWVKQLATRLRQNGVDARIDRFHLKPGTDLPQWMTNEVIMADKVVLVCDSNYVKKADVHKGGVGWENMIIQGDMLIQGASTDKYIAIVSEDQIDKGLPIYMRSRLCLHWPKTSDIKQEDFNELLFSIFDCSFALELGEIPKIISEKLSAKPPEDRQ